MESLGIESLNIGLPGAGPRAVEHTEALAREIATNRMKIRPNCAARTVEADIRPIAEISQRVGIAIEAATFLGSSPIRRLVEDWTVDHLERTTEKAVKFVVEHNLPSMFVTEDTIRTDRETVKRLYSTAIRNGARAIVLCDTVGHATPQGAYNLIKFAVEEIVKPSGQKIRVDWHGHNDRGLAIANSLAAIAGGANQIHAAANSLGERVGNTPMELMLVNLRLMGLIDRDLSRLKEYCEKVAVATHTTIPPNYPVIGHDAFRTATGVHAAAIVKAFHSNPALADIVYSGVPSHLFGLDQIIEIGPMSGKSNVMFWLERHKIPADETKVNRILAAAKQSARVLTDAEIELSAASSHCSRTAIASCRKHFSTSASELLRETSPSLRYPFDHARSHRRRVASRRSRQPGHRKLPKSARPSTGFRAISAGSTTSKSASPKFPRLRSRNPRAAKPSKRLFTDCGLEVSIDKTGNVIGELPGATDKEIVMLTAHLDTVFPPGTEVKVRRDGDRLSAPGISDNGTGLAGLIAIARAIHEAGIKPRRTILFVADVGEEGEGNLRGMRALVDTYHANSKPPSCSTAPAPITSPPKRSPRAASKSLITGPGGHSWSDFGMPNPINALVRGSIRFINTKVPVEPAHHLQSRPNRRRHFRQLDSVRSKTESRHPLRKRRRTRQARIRSARVDRRRRARRNGILARSLKREARVEDRRARHAPRR